MSGEQTVQEYLFTECSEGLFLELRDKNDWWDSSHAFVSEVKNNKMDTLTYRQKTWLMKIKCALLEEAEK